VELTAERKKHIDSLSVEELLRHNRFAPAGDRWFQGDTGDYWLERLFKLRSEDNAAYVRASKNIGWSG